MAHCIKRALGFVSTYLSFTPPVTWLIRRGSPPEQLLAAPRSLVPIMITASFGWCILGTSPCIILHSICPTWSPAGCQPFMTLLKASKFSAISNGAWPPSLQQKLLTSNRKDIGAVLAAKILVEDGRVSSGSRTRPAHPETEQGCRLIGSVRSEAQRSFAVLD